MRSILCPYLLLQYSYLWPVEPDAKQQKNKGWIQPLSHSEVINNKEKQTTIFIKLDATRSHHVKSARQRNEVSQYAPICGIYNKYKHRQTNVKVIHTVLEERRGNWRCGTRGGLERVVDVDKNKRQCLHVYTCHSETHSCMQLIFINNNIKNSLKTWQSQIISSGSHK